MQTQSNLTPRLCARWALPAFSKSSLTEKTMFTKFALAAILCLTMTVAACGMATPTSLTATPIPPTPIPADTATSIPPTPIPAETPTQPPPSPAAMPASAISLLANENEGYALRYPAEYHVVLFGRSICFTLAQTDGVPGTCHVADGLLEVSDMGGRTLANVADELAARANPTIPVTRTEAKIGGEDAILLDNIYSYDVLRQLAVIHNDRVYLFTFLPWTKRFDEFQRLQKLYSTLTESFTFLGRP